MTDQAFMDSPSSPAWTHSELQEHPALRENAATEHVAKPRGGGHLVKSSNVLRSKSASAALDHHSRDERLWEELLARSA